MMFSGIKWHWEGPFQLAHIEKTWISETGQGNV